MTPITRSADRARPVLGGALTALVTPFTPDGALDEAAFRRLVSWQVLSGIDGLVPCGTTGEAPTLDPGGARAAHRDHRRGRGRPRPRAAASRSSPAPARTTPTRRSAPPGGRPSSARTRRSSWRPTTTGRTSGCWRATSGPSRTRAACPSSSTTSRRGRARTSRRTRSCGWPRIRGSWPSRKRPGTWSRSRGSAASGRADVAVLAGDDAWTLPMLALGGERRHLGGIERDPGRDGRALRGRPRRATGSGARRIHERWLPLMLANFRGAPNPVPAKAALALMGLASDAVRAPAAARSTTTPRERLARLLRSLGLLELPGGRAAPDDGDARSRGRHERRATAPRDPRRDAATRPAAGADQVLAALEAGRLRAAVPGPGGAGRLGASGPRREAAILALLRGPRHAARGRPPRRSGSWTASACHRRTLAGSPDARAAAAAGRPWRIVPGGTSDPGRRAPRAGRRRHAAVVRQRRRLGRGRHDDRLARAGRLVRPGRRARPPRGRRRRRRRPGAGRGAAGHRRGRRVRRGGLPPPGRRAGRAGRGPRRPASP